MLSKTPLILITFIISPLVGNYSNCQFSTQSARADKTLSKKICGKNDTSFDYQFDINCEYPNGNGDSYEISNSSRNSESALVVQNENGETVFERESLKAKGYEMIVFEDKNENNDSFQNATSMYSVGEYKNGISRLQSWCNATISQKTEGALWWKKTYIDKDFYSFDVACIGTLDIYLTEIPAKCDYDIRLYKLEDSFGATTAMLNFNNYVAISCNSSNEDEKISCHVTPGTYYVCVYSYKDATYDNDIPYKLTFDEKVDATRKNASYYIDTGRYDDIGALWISDYKPLGLSPITMSNRQAKCQFSNYETYPYIRHLADNYELTSINYAVLFVWNLSARAYIYSYIQNMLNLLLNYSSWANESISSFNVVLNKTSFGINVGGYLIGEISEAVISKTASDLLNFLGFQINIAGFGLSLISFITSCSLENEFQIRRKDLIEYLVNLKAAFEIGKGSSEDQTIMLKFRYHFSDKKYIDWSPRYELGDSNMHNEDYISYQIPGSGINGSTYGISKVEDLNKYLES